MADFNLDEEIARATGKSQGSSAPSAPSAPATEGGFDLDAEIKRATQSLPSAPIDVAGASPISRSESVAQGAADTLAMGYSPQVGAAVKKWFPDFTRPMEEVESNPERRSYAEIRDEMKKFRDESQKQNPGAFLGGQVAGAVVPGVGLTGAGTKAGLGVAAPVVAGAIQGGSQASSRTDWDKPGQAALDTAIGAGVGGVAGAIPPIIAKGTKSALSMLADKLGMNSAKNIAPAAAQPAAQAAAPVAPVTSIPTGNMINGKPVLTPEMQAALAAQQKAGLPLPPIPQQAMKGTVPSGPVGVKAADQFAFAEALKAAQAKNAAQAAPVAQALGSGNAGTYDAITGGIVDTLKGAATGKAALLSHGATAVVPGLRQGVKQGIDKAGDFATPPLRKAVGYLGDKLQGAAPNASAAMGRVYNSYGSMGEPLANAGGKAAGAVTKPGFDTLSQYLGQNVPSNEEEAADKRRAAMANQTVKKAD